MLLRCISLLSFRQSLVRTFRFPPNRQMRSRHRSMDQLRPVICLSSNVRYSSSGPKVTQVPDNESEHGEIVYKGLVSSAVKNVKIFSLSTSLLGLGLQPILFTRAGDLGAIGIAFGGMCSFFIFMTPALLHWITKKYVSAVYFKPEERLFTAVTYSFFVRKKYTVFTPEDVKQPAAPGAFTSVLVKGKAMFMDGRHFENPEAYQIMMGYDKPIDWDFPEDIQALQGDNDKMEQPGVVPKYSTHTPHGDSSTGEQPIAVPKDSGGDEINKRRAE